MNARSQIMELSVEGRQIEEVVQGLFHTILLHRTTGKYNYSRDRHFTIGSINVQDVECDFLDFAYVKVISKELDARLKAEVSQFRDSLRMSEGQNSGQISLEFYRKQKSRWLFQAESSPWEVWTLKLNVVSVANENERQEFKRNLSELVTEKVFSIIDILNRHEYLPKVPTREEEDTVFDTTYKDIQPYLFKISHQTTNPALSSVGNTMRKFFRGSLAL